MLTITSPQISPSYHHTDKHTCPAGKLIHPKMQDIIYKDESENQKHEPLTNNYKYRIFANNSK
jgi:hypothetical protein